jgi:hypothetical protein
MNFVYQMEFADGESVIEQDSVLRYMAVSVALSNLDSYHGALAHNYYIYEQDGVFSMLPWDLNESFGTFNRDCNRVDIRELYIDEPTSGQLSERPLIAQVFANADNLNTYHDYLWQLINGPLSSAEFAARVDQIAEFVQNQSSTVERFYGLTSFIDYRVANMTQQLNGEIPSAGNGSGFCSN